MDPVDLQAQLELLARSDPLDELETVDLADPLDLLVRLVNQERPDAKELQVRDSTVSFTYFEDFMFGKPTQMFVCSDMCVGY